MPQPEIVNAADEAAEEAALEAGFGSEQDFTLPAPIEQPADVVAPPAETVVEPAATAPAITPSFTMDEVRTMLDERDAAHAAKIEKLQSHLFGKFGELNQKVEAARTAVHSGAGISPRARELMVEEFPELARIMFDDTVDPAAAPSSAPAATPVVTEDIKEDLRREFAVTQVRLVHKDYVDVVASDDFQNWKAAVLEPGLAEELDGTWDPVIVATRLTEYKGWRAAQAAQQDAEQKRQAALAAAVTPRGGAHPVASAAIDDEEAAMLEAFGRRN